MSSLAHFRIGVLDSIALSRYVRSKRWYRRLAAIPLPFRWVIAVGATATVAYVDFLSGDELSYSIFYLLPIAYATWFLRASAGLVRWRTVGIKRARRFQGGVLYMFVLNSCAISTSSLTLL